MDCTTKCSSCPRDTPSGERATIEHRPCRFHWEPGQPSRRSRSLIRDRPSEPRASVGHPCGKGRKGRVPALSGAEEASSPRLRAWVADTERSSRCGMPPGRRSRGSPLSVALAAHEGPAACSAHRPKQKPLSFRRGIGVRSFKAGGSGFEPLLTDPEFHLSASIMPTALICFYVMPNLRVNKSIESRVSIAGSPNCNLSAEGPW